MSKNLAWTQQQVNYVTIMSQVLVYAPAEREKTFSLFPLSNSILLVYNLQHRKRLHVETIYCIVTCLFDLQPKYSFSETDIYFL